MSASDKPDPRTATYENSIWDTLSEETFRKNLVILEERTNAIPIKPFISTSKKLEESSPQDIRSLSVQDEQRLADDFAYLAATGEGAQSVAAVCVEEYLSPSLLVLRFAAADAINDQVKVGLEEVGHFLMSESISSEQILERRIDSKLLSIIIDLHTQKLLGRLRSKKWQKPSYLARTHKKPLWQDLDNVKHRVQHAYPKVNHPKRLKVINLVEAMQSKLREFEEETANTTFALLEVVARSYQFCLSEAMADFANKLESLTKPTSQVSAAIKTIRQMEKVGAYQRIAIDLLHNARTHKDLFKTIRLEYLPPYQSIPTDISYESWARTLHVHAEVQLIVYYDMLGDEAQDQLHMPRCIGTSKYLCYLCYLFMRYHGKFEPANSHGRLYDQWTIPDLDFFTDKIRMRYRATIHAMNDEISKSADEIGPRQGKRDAWRVEPMTSRQNLLDMVTRQAEPELNESMKSISLEQKE